MTTKMAKLKAWQFPLPNPFEREQDEKMKNCDHLFENGLMIDLAYHLGNFETTLVKSDRYLVNERQDIQDDRVQPDLLVAFDVSLEVYRENNGYIISQQGKPPDFILEVASESTKKYDNGYKRLFYKRLMVGEYWRFDDSDGPGSVRVAGDELEGGGYREVPIVRMGDGILGGYSKVLGLYVRWNNRQLELWNHVTRKPIITRGDETERADRAEARVKELEDELYRLSNP